MRIAFCGTGGVGKTTLINLLKDYFSDREFVFLDEITRTLKENGFPINHDQTTDYNQTQLMILGAHLHNLSHSHFITDRCLIDGFAYTEYLALHNKVNSPVRDAAANALEAGLKMYDLIFYIPIEFAPENDGVRSVDINFIKGIDRIIQDYITEVKINRGITSIYTITGSVEERIEKIKNIIINGRG